MMNGWYVEVDKKASLKNILLLRTAALSRLNYFVSSVLSLLLFVALLGGVVYLEQQDKLPWSESLLVIFLTVTVISLFLGWLMLGLSLARWKNAGHKGMAFACLLIALALLYWLLSFSLANYGLLFFYAYLICKKSVRVFHTQYLRFD